MHGVEDQFEVVGRAPNLVYVARDATGAPSQAFRTLFLQETIERGFILPSLVVSYAHSEADIDLTIEAVADALGVYRKALEDGIDAHLRSRPVQPVMRPLQLRPPPACPRPYRSRHVRDLRGRGRVGEVDAGAAARAAPRRLGREVVATREPGGTPLGERVRGLLLDGEEMTPWAEAALFAAARAELAERVIRPALASGGDVVCDRYLDSSLVYQGIARGLGVERVLELNVAVRRPRARSDVRPPRRCCDGGERLGSSPRPHRARGRGIPAASLADGYRDLASRYPERIVVLDGARPEEELAAEIREDVARVR